MKIYKDIDGDSGVSAYEYGKDYIVVQFSTGAKYRYTYGSAEPENIEHMKKLADNGEGLNSFINTTVKKRYAQKER